MIRFLKKKGYFEDDLAAALPDEEMSQEELLPELQAASVQSKTAMGARKGQRVRRLGALEFTNFQPKLNGPLCAQISGFSRHAAVSALNPATEVPKKKRRMGWAELLAHVFAIDMKSCPRCSGELKISAAIKKILTHLNIPRLPWATKKWPREYSLSLRKFEQLLRGQMEHLPPVLGGVPDPDFWVGVA